MLTFVGITLLHTVSALLSGGFFISIQRSLVFICTKVWKELNNQVEIELKTKFWKFQPIIHIRFTSHWRNAMRVREVEVSLLLFFRSDIYVWWKSKFNLSL